MDIRLSKFWQKLSEQPGEAMLWAVLTMTGYEKKISNFVSSYVLVHYLHT